MKALYNADEVNEATDVLPFCVGVEDHRLQGLIARLILNALPSWKAASISSRVSLPRMVDFDWRVDLRAASEFSTNLSVPTLLVDMKVL